MFHFASACSPKQVAPFLVDEVEEEEVLEVLLLMLLLLVVDVVLLVVELLLIVVLLVDLHNIVMGMGKDQILQLTKNV